jgi:hypothetical protein
MKQPTILEGPWEEIRKHDAELIGQYVRLQILPKSVDASTNGKPEQSLAEIFKGRIGRFSFEPTDIAEKTEKYLEKGFGVSSLQQRRDP